MSTELQKILDALLEKYTSDRKSCFTLPDMLELLPISPHGNVNEIANKFGGTEQLRTAIDQLQALLYAE
jgi:hypothetical protein